MYKYKRETQFVWLDFLDKEEEIKIKKKIEHEHCEMRWFSEIKPDYIRFAFVDFYLPKNLKLNNSFSYILCIYRYVCRGLYRVKI